MTNAIEGNVIEGVVTEVADEPERHLAVLSPQQSVQVGLGAVMALSDDDFERNLDLLRKGVSRAKRMQEALLEPGVDYGTVPGIRRPFLHKPGAEKFEKAYGLAISYDVERKVGDGVKTPELEYIVHAKVHLGATDGPIVGEGLGSCNTHESKYRYRQAQQVCPTCNQPSIIKGRDDGRLRGKWWCNTHKGGCGASFEKDDKRLTEQVVGQVENENPYDLANTILKMARKRAGVDGILTATGTSGLFTQDPDSPSVERDSSARTDSRSDANADDGAAPDRGGPPAALVGDNTARKLPSVSKDITEPRALGQGDIVGKVALRDKAPSDGLMRQTADEGSAIGFVLDVNDAQRIAQVEVRGVLAEQLAEKVRGELKSLVGQWVNLEGEMFAMPWKKQGEAMPPFFRFRTTRIRTADWSIPSTDSGVVEGIQREGVTAPATAAAPESKPKRQAKATAEPGLTIEQFREAIKGQRISPAFIESASVDMFGEKDPAALTDEQRKRLVDFLDEP